MALKLWARWVQLSICQVHLVHCNSCVHFTLCRSEVQVLLCYVVAVSNRYGGKVCLNNIMSVDLVDASLIVVPLNSRRCYHFFVMCCFWCSSGPRMCIFCCLVDLVDGGVKTAVLSTRFCLCLLLCDDSMIV